MIGVGNFIGLLISSCKAKTKDTDPKVHVGQRSLSGKCVMKIFQYLLQTKQQSSSERRGVWEGLFACRAKHKLLNCLLWTTT